MNPNIESSAGNERAEETMRLATALQKLDFSTTASQDIAYKAWFLKPGEEEDFSDEGQFVRIKRTDSGFEIIPEEVINT